MKLQWGNVTILMVIAWRKFVSKWLLELQDSYLLCSYDVQKFKATFMLSSSPEKILISYSDTDILVELNLNCLES